MNILPTKDELLQVLDEAQSHSSDGQSKFPAMSYEDGVVATIQWILAITTSKPMED